MVRGPFLHFFFDSVVKYKSQPMFQREALWIGFAGSEECAVKISVGGE